MLREDSLVESITSGLSGSVIGFSLASLLSCWCMHHLGCLWQKHDRYHSHLPNQHCQLHYCSQGCESHWSWSHPCQCQVTPPLLSNPPSSDSNRYSSIHWQVSDRHQFQWSLVLKIYRHRRSSFCEAWSWNLGNSFLFLTLRSYRPKLYVSVKSLQDTNSFSVYRAFATQWELRFPRFFVLSLCYLARSLCSCFSNPLIGPCNVFLIAISLIHASTNISFIRS